MKHLKPSLALLLIIAALLAFLYWPMDGVIAFVIAGVVILLVLIYRVLYEHFNKK